MFDDYLIDPATGKPRTARERQAYRDRLDLSKRPEHLTPDQQTLDHAKRAAADARRMADRLRANGVFTDDQRRQLKRLESQADEFEQRAAEQQVAEEKLAAAKADPAYLLAKEHAESFARSNPDQDRAKTAIAILDGGDVKGYWAEVDAIWKVEFDRINKKHADAELAKLKADRDLSRVKVEVAELEGKQP